MASERSVRSSRACPLILTLRSLSFSTFQPIAQVFFRRFSETWALCRVHPADREEFQNGKIYVAPPDYHLLIARGHVRVVRGPQENRSGRLSMLCSVQPHGLTAQEFWVSCSQAILMAAR